MGRSGQRKTWRRLRADSDTDSHDDSQAASHCHPPSDLDGHLPGSHAAVADAPEAQACGICGGISDLLEAPLGKLCQDCWADLPPDTVMIGEERPELYELGIGRGSIIDCRYIKEIKAASFEHGQDAYEDGTHTDFEGLDELDRERVKRFVTARRQIILACKDAVRVSTYKERSTASINHMHRRFLKTVTEDGSLEQFILFDLSHYSPQVKAWLGRYHDDMSAFLDLPNLFPCSWGCYEIRNPRKTGYHGSSTGKPKTQNERWSQAERARHYSKYNSFSLEEIKERRKRNDKGDRYDSNCLFIDMDNKMADWWVRRVLINMRPVFCSEGYTDFDLVAQRLFLT